LRPEQCLQRIFDVHFFALVSSEMTEIIFVSSAQEKCKPCIFMAAPCGCDKGMGQVEHLRNGSQQKRKELLPGEVEVEQMPGSLIEPY